MAESRTHKILEVRGLTTKLKLGKTDYTVVDRLSFDLCLDKTLALVGESGCGKSMTALSLMKILPEPPALPPEGEVIYQGRNLLKLNDREMRKIRGKSIAMIFQDPMSALNPVYTIGEQLMEVARLHLNLDEDDAKKRCLQALEEVGIPSPSTRFEDYPHQFSGGMKQRAMIAMALLCEPDILIADEPTTALDVTIQKQVLDLMQRLQREKGMAILLITHDMGVVAEMADDVVVMYATKEVESGPVEEVFNRLAHPYTQGLFQSLPTLETPKSKLHVIKGAVPSIRHIPPGCPFHPRCPHVMEVCTSKEVKEFQLQHADHTTRCWLYE